MPLDACGLSPVRMTEPYARARPATRRPDPWGCSQVAGVDDPVGVPLLGEEALPVLGEVGVDRVARHDGVEVSRAALGLGSQQPAQPLGLLLARPEGPADLDG